MLGSVEEDEMRDRISSRESREKSRDYREITLDDLTAEERATMHLSTNLSIDEFEAWFESGAGFPWESTE